MQLAVFPLTHHFGDALGCPEYIGRINGLVRGNHDHFFTLILDGRISEVLGRKDIISDRLTHLALQDGHMFIGGGVKDHIRLKLLYHMKDLIPFTQIAKYAFPLYIGKSMGQLALYAIQVKFITLENNQPSRIETGNLQ